MLRAKDNGRRSPTDPRSRTLRGLGDDTCGKIKANHINHKNQRRMLFKYQRQSASFIVYLWLRFQNKYKTEHFRTKPVQNRYKKNIFFVTKITEVFPKRTLGTRSGHVEIRLKNLYFVWIPAFAGMTI